MTRFTLTNLLLQTALIGMATALFSTTSQLTKARAELLKLRNESRLLDPSEPNQMRAIQMPAFGRNQWRWRVDLPDDEQFVLRWAYNGIPFDKSLPKEADTSFRPPKLPSDEFLLSIAALQEDGQWMLGVSTQSDSGRGEVDFATPMNAKDSSWLSRRGGNSVHRLAGERETEVHPADSPFVLLRFRKGLTPSPGVTAMDPQPTDGILVWIEKAKGSVQGRTK